MSSELVKQLYAPFDFEDHDIRIGSTKNKAQWFVYVRREAITRRLDELFPLNWSVEILEVRQCEKFAVASMRLTIAGMSRDNNGSQSGSGEHAEKGAVTDAFKRVASCFGLGLYLQSSPSIWTDGGFSGDNGRVSDWNKYNAQELQAKNKFRDWHKNQFTIAQAGNSSNPTPAPKKSKPQKPVPWNGYEGRVTKFFGWCESVMSDYSNDKVLEALNESLDVPIDDFTGMVQYPGDDSHAQYAIIAWQSGYDNTNIPDVLAAVYPEMSDDSRKIMHSAIEMVNKRVNKRRDQEVVY